MENPIFLALMQLSIKSSTYVVEKSDGSGSVGAEEKVQIPRLKI